MEAQQPLLDHKLLVGVDADQEFSRLFAEFLGSRLSCSIFAMERQQGDSIAMKSFKVIRGADDNFDEIFGQAKNRYKMLILDQGSLLSEGWKAVYHPEEKILSILSRPPIH